MESKQASSRAIGAEPADAQGPFRHIVCGVDGSPSASEAVRQAGALAAGGTTIDLVAVAYEPGSGSTARAQLGTDHATKCLKEAAQLLAETPAHVSTRIARGHPTWEVLLDAAAGCDLLVLGRHGTARALGVAFGSTASSVVHRGRLPILMASLPPDGAEFPSRILVAADGPGHPEDAVRIAAEIARHAGNADITLLRLDWSRRAKHPELASAIADAWEITGHEPEEILIGGTPHRRIPEYAARENASLVVLGTRELTGVRALRSVSERVAHEAPCSVLIAHGHHDDQA